MPSRRRRPSPSAPVADTWDRRLLEDAGLKYDWVKTEDIQVDPTYQRPLREQRVAMMIEKYNPDELTAVVVSKRPDGSIWMLDGQHRLETVKRLGKAVILADIREGLTKEQEAFLFYRLNEGQTRVGAWDKFRARQAAKEVHALRITKIVEDNGFFIGPVAEGGIQAVSALESAYNMGRLNKTLQIIAAVWPNDRVSKESGIILGLSQFLLTFDDMDTFDEGRVLTSLDTIGPSHILRRAKEIAIETGRSGQRGGTTAIAFRDAYNGLLVRGAKPKRQLTGVPIVRWTRERRGAHVG